MLMGVNACQSSDDETVSTNSETLVHSHAIPVEEALSSLNDFLKDDFTRANGSLPKVTNVIPVKLNEVATRAAATNDVENVIYVANFADDKGFAVLAADDRIKDKVIAVTNKSNFTKAAVDAIISLCKDEETYIMQNGALRFWVVRTL